MQWRLELERTISVPADKLKIKKISGNGPKLLPLADDLVF